MKGKNKGQGFLRFMGLFAFGLIAGGISWVLCEEKETLFINLIFLVIMLVIMGKGLLHIGSLDGVTAVFQQVTGKEGYKEDALKAVITNILYEEKRYLKKAYNSYLKEKENAKKRVGKETGRYRLCDISDYINEELLDKVVHTSFNDLVGSMMTGLGILGTFIGLIIGLKGFNTDPDKIMDSIIPLIGGMKVAFLTSVFGIVASLLYNAYYRYKREQAEGAMKVFLQSYYTWVEPRANNEVSGVLVEYQERQTALLEGFSGAVAVAIANVLPNAINEAVLPELNKWVENSEQITQQLAEQQSKSLERLVQNFVRQMNKALGNQMEELGVNIQKLSNMQRETQLELQTASERLRSATGEFEKYMDAVKQNQRENTKQLQQIQAVSKQMTAEFERIVSSSEQCHKTLMQTFEEGKKENQNRRLWMKVEEKSLSEALKKQLEQSQKQIEEMRASLQTQEEQISKRMSGAGEKMLQAFQQSTQRQVEQQTHEIRETQKMREAFLTELTSAMEAIHQALGDEIAKHQENMQKLAKEQEKMQKELQATSEQCNKVLMQNVEETRKMNRTQRLMMEAEEKALCDALKEQRELTQKQVEELRVSLQKQEQQIYEQMSATGAEVLEAFQQTAQRLREQQRMDAQGMSAVQKEIDAGLADTVEKMKVCTEYLGRVTTEFAQACNDCVRQTGEQQRQIDKSFYSVKAELEQLTESFRDVAKELNKQASTIQQEEAFVNKSEK